VSAEPGTSCRTDFVKSRIEMIDVKAKFVAVVIFQVNPGDLPGMAREVQRTVDRKLPTLNGFIGSVVMSNEEKTQLLVVSLWESRDAWSLAQWDQEIGRTVTDEVETAKSFEVRTYEPITIVRAGEGT
jgi:heme-degrading monooxygenase HmoA